MRIERIRVDGFGRLQGLDTGPDPLPNAVVVLGPNEAGKSTLFHFLTTLLYGFQPASRDRHPYLPWGRDEAGGALEVRLDSGALGRIERRLRSQPRGTLSLDGLTQSLANHPLPWVQHIPRAVFEQVFALTLADLAQLDREAWARIQDRVVGAMGASDLRPAREVASLLEQEASELWRPTRRGRQRIREIQTEIRALRGRQRAAMDRDRAIRTLAEEGEEVTRRLERLRSERARALGTLERIRTLHPVRNQLLRIAELRGSGGPLDELRGLPRDPAQELARLDGQAEALSRRVEALEEERREPEEVCARFGPEEARILVHRDELRGFIARASAVAGDRVRAHEVGVEMDAQLLELDQRSRAVLARPWHEIPAEAIDAASTTLLHAHVERLDSEDQQRALTPPPRSSSPLADRTVPPAVVALLLFGVTLLSWGITSGSTYASMLGSAVTAVGLVSMFGRGARPRATAPTPGPPLPDRTPAETHPVVSQMLRDLQIRPEVAARPDLSLVASIEHLQRLTRAHRTASRALAELERRIDATDLEGRSLATTFGVAEGLDPAALPNALDERIRRAERLEDAAAAARRELRRVEAEQARLNAERGEALGAREALLGAIARLSGSTGSEGLEAVGARLRAHERADQLEAELERSHPDLVSLKARIEAAEQDGEPWTRDEHELAHLQDRAEALNEEIEQLAVRSKAIEQDIAHHRLQETADDIDGAIESLREEEERAVLERDRTWVIAQLLREADRAFRDEHQPDLLRRAGGYLSRLTSGRYDRIEVEEGGEDGRFLLSGPGGGPIALTPPLSTGTLEQGYLGLRLAIVDHLDHGGERLPLFMDEVFVNWDPERARRGMALVGDVSSRRQLFLFTCHPPVAAALEGEGARILTLPIDG